MNKNQKILSIDWDYFIGCDNYHRGMLFPDGGNEDIGIALNLFVWATLYGQHPEISDIPTHNPDYLDMLSAIKAGKFQKPTTQVFVADSHREIYTQLEDRYGGEKWNFTIYNIDHHHDYYGYEIEHRINCGNWLNALADANQYGDFVDKIEYTWVKRDDSDPLITAYPDWFKTCSFEDFIKEDLRFDFVFICKSPIWSPPHLDKKFEEMLNTMLYSGWDIDYEDLSADRNSMAFQQQVAQWSEQYKDMKKQFGKRVVKK